MSNVRMWNADQKCKIRNALNSVAAHLVEDTVGLLDLHHVQDIKWDVSGLAAAIPKLPPLFVVLNHLPDTRHISLQSSDKCEPTQVGANPHSWPEWSCNCISLMTPMLWYASQFHSNEGKKKLHFDLCVKCFYLEDFILQHWQLVGIPCYKVVANFGIFPRGGHSIVRPVKTRGI